MMINIDELVNEARTIYFDMDGTIADLYSVENWLPMLRDFDPTPYKKAKVMHNMSYLARLLNVLRQNGYKVGIISWLSMDSTFEYDTAVIKAKIDWLELHLASVEFDEIHIVPYGTPKEQFSSGADILFDDTVSVRENWNGEAYPPEQIFEVLKNLL
jgi:hypothetical protein